MLRLNHEQLKCLELERVFRVPTNKSLSRQQQFQIISIVPLTHAFIFGIDQKLLNESNVLLQQ